MHAHPLKIVDELLRLAVLCRLWVGGSQSTRSRALTWEDPRRQGRPPELIWPSAEVQRKSAVVQ